MARLAFVTVTWAAGSCAFAGWTVRVIDDRGEPVSRFEVLIHTADKGFGLWTAGAVGAANLSLDEDARVVDVIARADGFASSVTRFAGNDREKLKRGEAVIELKRGKTVKLQFRLPPGLSWPPHFLPETYFTDHQTDLRWSRTFDKEKPSTITDCNMLNAQAEGAGVFSLRLSGDMPPFAIGIHAPGFLQYFEGGTYKAGDVRNDRIEIDVPRPATLVARFDSGDVDHEKLPFTNITLRIWRYVPQMSRAIQDAARLDDAPIDASLAATDLSPGRYAVRLYSTARPGLQKVPGTDITPGDYLDLVGVRLTSGQVEKVVLKYAPVDLQSFRGNRTAVVRLQNSDGTPAAGHAMKFTYFDVHYGPLPVFLGPIPESGEVVITGLTDRPRELDELTEPYTVKIDGKWVGSFRFRGHEPTERFEVRLAPDIGDSAPDIELTDIATGKTLRLHDLRGKIVCLDFWATWCSPCQPAMEKLNQLAAESDPTFNDRVRIVPVSIDDSIESVAPHSRNRGWSNLTHYWTGKADQVGWNSPAARIYGIDGVPTSILLGPDGRILWRGNPLAQEGEPNIEERIGAALQGLAKINGARPNAEARDKKVEKSE